MFTYSQNMVDRATTNSETNTPEDILKALRDSIAASRPLRISPAKASTSSRPEDRSSKSDKEGAVEKELQDIFDKLRDRLLEVYSTSSVMRLYQAVCPLPKKTRHATYVKHYILRHLRHIERASDVYVQCIRQHPILLVAPLKSVLSILDYQRIMDLTSCLLPKGLEEPLEPSDFSHSTLFSSRFTWQALREKYGLERARMYHNDANEIQALINEIGNRLAAKHSYEVVKSLHERVCKALIKPPYLNGVKMELLSCLRKYITDSNFARRFDADPFKLFERFIPWSEHQLVEFEPILKTLGIPYGLLGKVPEHRISEEEMEFFRMSAFIDQFQGRRHPLDRPGDVRTPQIFQIQGYINEIAYELSHYFPFESVRALQESVCDIEVCGRDIWSIKNYIELTRYEFKRDWYFRFKVLRDPFVVFRDLPLTHSSQNPLSTKELQRVKFELKVLWPWWSRIDVQAIIFYSVIASSPKWLDIESDWSIYVFVLCSIMVFFIELDRSYFKWAIVELPALMIQLCLEGISRLLENLRESMGLPKMRLFLIPK